MEIADLTVVTIDYTLTNEDGEEIDTSRDGTTVRCGRTRHFEGRRISHLSRSKKHRSDNDKGRT